MSVSGRGQARIWSTVKRLSIRTDDGARPNRAGLRRDWTQEDVARRLGTTRLTVGRWQRGIQTPSLHFRGRLCGLFGAGPGAARPLTPICRP
ncbi:MAG TPA: helix-turn-helix transcriptional regulator [Candidatus Dormibacteraeota bacterium]